jgi:thiamine monophosphate kinase
MKLGDLGEDQLLDQLLPRLSLKNAVVVGPATTALWWKRRIAGDLLVLKTDCVVKGCASPAADVFDVGWKAMMRPLSDFAATSAVPQFALITLVAPEQTTIAWVKELYRPGSGGEALEVSIVGGERARKGRLPFLQALLDSLKETDGYRAGGKAGDDLFVTGRLGVPETEASAIHPADCGIALAYEKFLDHAMMDVSDDWDRSSRLARQQSRI